MRRDLRPWALGLVAIAAGLLALVILPADEPGETIEAPPVAAAAEESDAPAAAAPEPEPEPSASHPPPAPVAATMRAQLERAVAEGAALGGAVEASVLHESWAEPVVAVAGGGDPDRRVRMWSTSKVVTLVALLRALGWGEERGEPLSAEAEGAVRGAITRSENCRQRRVLLELQERTGGPGGARRALEEVLAVAGARAQVARAAEPPDELCTGYLGRQHGLADPLAPALLLGTSTWEVADAARFMSALGDDAYGSAVRGYALRILRAPKRLTRETSASEYTAALDWGAGRALADADPAYKAGWGGTLQGAFVAEQMALAEVPGAGRTAVAVAFHPDSQPSRDDPGLTAAPQAIERVMQALARELKRAGERGSDGA